MTRPFHWRIFKLNSQLAIHKETESLHGSDIWKFKCSGYKMSTGSRIAQRGATYGQCRVLPDSYLFKPFDLSTFELLPTCSLYCWAALDRLLGVQFLTEMSPSPSLERLDIDNLSLS